METFTKTRDSSIRIFVIDDDPFYRQAIEQYFKPFVNYKIYPFDTGEPCFRYVRAQQPDLIILDYRLDDKTHPGAMNGIEILKRLQRLKPGIPVIMLSGQESFEVATNSIQNGAFDYIVKNENAFIRLRHLTDKVLYQRELNRIAKQQDNYSRILMTGSLFVALSPILINRAAPDIMPWFTIVSLCFLILMAALISRIKLQNPDKKLTSADRNYETAK